MSDLAFKKEVEQAIKLYEQAIGHAATRTWHMIEKYGEKEALSRLMVSADLQQGFKVLRDRNQLQKTFEAVVVRYKNLFKPDIVEAAQWRLDNPKDLLWRESGTSCSDKSKRKVFLLTNSPSKCLKKHDIERRVAHL